MERMLRVASMNPFSALLTVGVRVTITKTTTKG